MQTANKCIANTMSTGNLEHFRVNRIYRLMKFGAGVITRDCIYSALARVESANLLRLAGRRAPREEIPHQPWAPLTTQANTLAQNKPRPRFRENRTAVGSRGEEEESKEQRERERELSLLIKAAAFSISRSGSPVTKHSTQLNGLLSKHLTSHQPLSSDSFSISFSISPALPPHALCSSLSISRREWMGCWRLINLDAAPALRPSGSAGRQMSHFIGLN